MSDNKEKVVEIKIEKNRIIIEQVNKKIVDTFNFVIGTRNEHYNYACFEILDQTKIRYFPFNRRKFLSYEEKLPAITEKSCILSVDHGMKILNDLLSSRLWKVWGQDDEGIQKQLSE